MEPLEINGDAPLLAGLRCDAILCVEYWHAGRVVELVNSVNLCFSDGWHRLYFDHGIIFWQPDDGPPKSYAAPEIDSFYRVIDVAVVCALQGVCLSAYEMKPIEGGSRVTFAFENGRSLAFSSVNDLTSYHWT